MFFSVCFKSEVVYAWVSIRMFIVIVCRIIIGILFFFIQGLYVIEPHANIQVVQCYRGLPFIQCYCITEMNLPQGYPLSTINFYTHGVVSWLVTMVVERKCPHIKISTGKMFIGVGVAFLEEASNCGGGLLGLLCSGYYLVWSSLLLVHCWSRCRTPKI